MECKSCGAQIAESGATCPYCNAAIAKAPVIYVAPVHSAHPSSPSGSSTIAEPDVTGLSRYYQDEFRKIHQSGEKYKGKWNWTAFFFSWIWGLTKGIWLPSLVYLFIFCITRGVFSIVWLFLFPKRANWIYYNLRIKNKRLWL